MDYELYTLEGKLLLDHARIHAGKRRMPALDFSQELILSYKKRGDSAVFYQLGKMLQNEGGKNTAGCFDKIWFYVDFNSARPIDAASFSLLFNRGFYLRFDGGEPVHYVPFATSQSQSKEYVYSFVRADVAAALMPRLDLDLPLEKDARNKSLDYLPKLYAYRALYMSAATEALRCDDPSGPAFFNCENIIVLPEVDRQKKVKVFTAKATKALSESGDAILTQEETTDYVSLTCFDGAGIMSQEACKMINDKLPEKLKGNSFQIRMPFLKGVLHAVDFHAYIKEKFLEKGTEITEAFIMDAFHRKRDLLKANVIIRPSVFKLFSLLKSCFKNEAARDQYFAEQIAGGDIMQYYFEKLQKYNHGLYIVKSENSFRNTQYVHLSSQQLSTFDLSAEDLDGIVADQIATANAFTAENLADKEKRKALLCVEDKTGWMELLLKDERFLKDPHIRAMVKAHRISLLNDIALGRLLVKGENRFLCGDLYVFLADMLERIAVGGELPFAGVCEQLRKDNKLLSENAVYVPGVEANGQRVALIRSPHLSRNEDICTIMKSKKDYEKYLGHLTGVVFTGDLSRIPAALGGADFDGDSISVIYDRRIIDACRAGGYTEIHNTPSAVPFIHITGIKPKTTKIKAYQYISPQVVYNTFSNRVGQISNTAMKIAAVEYDPNLKKSRDLPNAAFCTILTGNEIDAAKKGIRPYIDDVLGFSKNLDEEACLVVKEIENYIKMKRELENKSGQVPEVSLGPQGGFCLPEGSAFPVKTFMPNRERNAVAQLLYRWAEAFYGFKAEEKEEERAFDRKTLMEIFDAKPVKATQCKDIIAAFRAADNAFAETAQKRRAEEEQLDRLASLTTVRLKGQYDNIYIHTAKDLSYKDKFEVFKKELLALTKERTRQEICTLKDLIYSVKAEQFRADRFWPYTKDQSARDNALFNEVLALPYAELICNFEFEGYRLLHYVLEEAAIRKETLDVSGKINKNEYNQNYFSICEESIRTRRSKAKFESTLASMAIKDLAEAEGLDLRDANAKFELAARLYPQYDASLTGTFWKIFSEYDVMTALGGMADA